MQYFSGPPEIAIDELPAIKLSSLSPGQTNSLFMRLLYATRKRSFVLVDDWHISLNKISYHSSLNGRFLIPVLDKQGKAILFDGASVPMPWLISLLTVGILRPLGVMLIASIVHDYAYKFGHLRKIAEMEEEQTLPDLARKHQHDGQSLSQSEDAAVEVPLTREQADRLFRDMISSINQLPLIGQIAWLFVRIGWFFRIRYNGVVYGGKAPIASLLVVTLVLSLLIGVSLAIGVTKMCLTIVSIYLVAYLASIMLSERAPLP